LPDEVFQPFSNNIQPLDWSHQIDQDGHWALEPYHLGHAAFVHLYLGEPFAEHQMTVITRGSALVLAFYIGDPDDENTFEFDRR
jgi:hypothetical protein